MVEGVREVNEVEGAKGSKRSEGPKAVMQLKEVERCRGPRLPSAGNPIRCLAHHIPESRFRIRHESRIRKASQTLAAVRHSHPFITPPPHPPPPCAHAVCGPRRPTRPPPPAPAAPPRTCHAPPTVTDQKSCRSGALPPHHLVPVTHHQLLRTKDAIEGCAPAAPPRTCHKHAGQTGTGAHQHKHTRSRWTSPHFPGSSRAP